MNSFDFLRSPVWWRGLIVTAFGKSFLGFAAAAAALGALCWGIKGPDAVWAAITEDVELMIGLMPRVVIALSIAGLIWVMMPRENIGALVGDESGLRGIVIATLAGTVTPGGPSSAFALLAVLAGAGAGRGAMVAYITAWATLGMQRILIWDVPFMGAEFAILRFAIGLPLPIIAGLIARQLPLDLHIKDSELPPSEDRKAGS